MTKTRPTLLVIDPAGHTPELACYNRIASFSRMPTHYHLPALHGFSSMQSYDSGSIAGIIILGSSASVYDDLNWQAELIEWLEKKIAKNTPTLGICYGHQLIAHMFGGKVIFNTPNGTAKEKGFRTITFDDTQIWGPAKIRSLVVSHREHVAEIPPGFFEIARSDSYPNEAIAHQSKPLWGVQAHPEAVMGFMANNNISPPETNLGFADGWALITDFIHFCGAS